MHICFLSPEYISSDKPEGGLANYLHKIGHSLAVLGNTVTIFVLSDEDKVWSDGLIAVHEVKQVVPPKILFTKIFRRFFRFGKTK